MNDYFCREYVKVVKGEVVGVGRERRRRREVKESAKSVEGSFCSNFFVYTLQWPSETQWFCVCMMCVFIYAWREGKNVH